MKKIKKIELKETCIRQPDGTCEYIDYLFEPDMWFIKITKEIKKFKIYKL